jgi:hypothetical protein
MGVCLTINLVPFLSDAVKAYFTKFSVLPPKNLKVDSTKVVQGPKSLEALMDAMIALKDKKEFVIVTHGFEDGSGLYLKLATRGDDAGGKEVKHGVLTDLMTIAARNPAKVTADDNTNLDTRGKEIERLIEKMKKIQAMGINAVEFRGCNLGRNQNSVGVFKKFFGAGSFGAPKLHSFFGSGPAKSGGQMMTVHTQSHSTPTITYSQTFAGKTCHCCIGLDEHRKPMNGHIVADDATTLDAWIHANFSQTTSLGTDAKLSTHGLWYFPPANTNDPIPIDPDPVPIFPLQTDTTGQNVYSLNIVYV